MRDLAAGAFLLAIAAAIVWFGRDLPMGVGTRLGPGYVPRVLGILIGLLGIIIFVRALARHGERISPSNLKGVALILGAILLFTLLLPRLGLAVASVVLLFISSIAAPDFRIWQSVLFTICLTAASAMLFVWGLGMNVRIMPW